MVLGDPRETVIQHPQKGVSTHMSWATVLKL